MTFGCPNKNALIRFEVEIVIIHFVFFPFCPHIEAGAFFEN